MNEFVHSVKSKLGAGSAETGVAMASPFVRWGLRYAPWLWLIIFGMFSLAAAYQVGAMPMYGQPDPKDVDGLWGLLYLPIIGLTIWVLASIPIMLALFVQKIWRQRTLAVQYLLWYILGIAMWAFIVLGDLFGLMTWLMD